MVYHLRLVLHLSARVSPGDAMALKACKTNRLAKHPFSVEQTMTDRYELYIASMQEASRTVMILFCLACAITGARGSIKFAPEKIRRGLYVMFDCWLIVVNLVLFIVSP